MSDEDTNIDTKGLDKLIKMFGSKMPTSKVGVLGQKSARDGGANNAEIGARHEFGEGGMPERSFLRVPVAEHLDAELESSGALEADTLKQAMQEASFVPYMKKIATIAEGIVAEAFDTGGFGKWQPSDFTRKKNAQTLVETQQLRNSITSETKEGQG